MSNPIAPTGGPTLRPAAARSTRAGEKSLAHVPGGRALEGREAVKKIARAATSDASDPRSGAGRGRRVNRIA